MAYQPGRSDVPLDEAGERVDRRLVVRVAVGVVAVGLTLLFIFQNNERVETSFVFFEVTTRAWVSLLVALVLGALLGQAAEMLWNRRKRRSES
jgi:uncharacterized integral membrane protein